jgi:protein-tyrosine phosphatase
MFFFKKSKPFLKDLIPNDYIDIHSHLLPAIDDGAKSIADSKLLISSLFDLGFSEIITTPHIIKNVWNNTSQTISKNYKSLTLELTDILNNKPFNFAAEYMMDEGFFENLKRNEPLLTLKDNYVLVEMSYLNPPLILLDIIFEIQVAGYIPVLAHPERYTFYHNNLSEYKKLKNSGCLFQLNLLSSVNYYGENVSKTTDYLLEKNMIDFVGSDVHHMKHIDFFNKKIVLKNIDFLKPVFQNNLIFKH